MKKIKFLFIIMLMLLVPSNVFALNEVNVYFFYDGTKQNSLCNQEKVYLEALKDERYPNMRIYFYEVNDEENEELMKKAKTMYNVKENTIPFTIVGDMSVVGFSQNQKALIQKTVYEYSTKTYGNKFGKSVGITYRNDLEGTVKEYKTNAEYVVEETSGKDRTVKTSSSFDKYQVTFYLVVAGVVLAFIAYLIHLMEKKGRI